MTKARDLANAGTALTSVSATELGYLDGVTSAVQTQLNAKQPTVANVSDTEIGYLDGVTSAIQTQLDAKVSTAGGSVISANSSGNALEIRQTGAGNALKIEDSANPDSTPFVVDASGTVGINTDIAGAPKLQANLNTAVGNYPWESATAAFRDQRAMAAGVGGGVIFEGNYLTAGGNAAFGGIRGSKTNSTSGAANGDMHYWSRQGAHKWYVSEQVLGSEGTPAMQIASDGATTVVYTTTTGGAVRNIYMSTSAPSGGSDGDVWIQYTA